MKDKIKSHFNGNYKSFFEKYLSDIKGLKGDEYQALCCFHDDKKPSFNFSIKNGRYFCHGCHTKGDIFTFFAKRNGLSIKSDFQKILKGIAENFGIQNGKPGINIVKNIKRNKIIAEYIYNDPDGKPRHKVARTESKDFYQSSYINGQWSRGTKGIDLVPYNLQAVIKADEIIIIEGEKDVDTLKTLGFVGTTNAMGAGCWKDSYNIHLKGKSVVLIPDNDEEGRKHMLNVAQSLDGQPKSLKWLELPGLQKKGDVSDFIAKFDDKDEAVERLALLIRNAGSWEKELQQKDEKTPETLKKELKSLVPLDLLTREIEIKRIVKEYDIRKGVIDRYIKEFTKKDDGSPEVVTEIEPYEQEVDGVMLLNSISEELLKYVILPSGAANAIAAWTVLTYSSDAFRILPILGITSPVKRCGKTTLLEVLQGLTNKGLTASNISPAAVFRTIDKYHPTLLIDEADTFLKDNDELRGVLNSGHTKTTAFVIRVEGESHEPVKFSTWGPKAIGMIKDLPETLQDRSVVIKLRRKMPDERATKLDIDFESGCIDIRRKCRRWADDNLDELTITRPEIPKTNNDRMTDNWLPLFAIAEVTGGAWPDKIKKSMSKMMCGEDDNIGVMLLEDIREIFDSKERIFSCDLVDELKQKLDRPWSDWNRGKGLTQNGLGRLLKPFSVQSKTMRIADDQKKGYESKRFEDVFSRYLPVSSVPAYQGNKINNLDDKQSVPNKKGGTDGKQAKQLKLQGCYAGTDEIGGVGENKELPEWKRLNFKSEEHYSRAFS